MTNKLIIAAAGSGKTTFIVNESLKIKDKQILIRLLDDYIYQTIVRQEVRKTVDEEQVQNDVLLEKVRELFKESSTTFIEQTNMKYEVDSIYLPWDRSFEIGIEVKSYEQEGFS